MTGKVYKSKECPTCNESFKQIGQHWRWNPEHRPSFNQEQWEISIGLLMGDGTVNKGNKNPRLEASMITKPYLNWLDKKFDYLSNGVRKTRTAREGAENNMGRELFPTVNKENYHDLYKWSTPGHPDLSELAKWYTDSGKNFPDNIKLTKNVLKHWYVSDGYYADSGTCDHITIALSNERENKKKVESYFVSSGLPKPDNWKIYERSDGFIDCEIRWRTENSKKLWSYMGDPVPGFEYKWPEALR